MGFFSKKNQDIFDSLNPMFTESIFPGGRNECAQVLNSLRRIITNNDDDMELVKFYSGLIIRCSGDSQAENILNRVKIKLTLPMNNLEIYKAIAFTQNHLSNNTFYLDNPSNMKVIEFMAQSYIEMEQFSKTNDLIDPNYYQSSLYGLEFDTPIFVSGIRESKNYISKLTTLEGEPLTWFREGSIATTKVAGNTDIYKLYLNNTEFGKIYINVYSHLIATKAPKGYLLSDKPVSFEHSNNNVSKVPQQEPEKPKEPAKPIIQKAASTIEMKPEIIREDLCSKCNLPIKKENKFCEYCGAEILKVAQPIVSAVEKPLESLKCKVCGIDLREEYVFCPSCGTKVESISKVISPEIIISEPQNVSCVNCGATNISTEKYCFMCGKSVTKKSVSRSLIIKVAIALSLILTVFGIYSYDSYKTAEAERLRLEKIAEEEENRISTALAEPSLYWKMTYSAPYKEGYSAKDTAYYANGGVVKGYICVLVGVNLKKDTSSSYYLDNTIDQGKANFRTTDFTLNNQNPWIPIGRENYCAKAFKGFRIVDTYEFDEYQNQPFFLLFIIDVNDKQNSQFSWKDKVITTLPDLFSK